MPSQPANVDRALLRALCSPAMYRGHPAVTVHETHASWVFVAGDRAYKIKKPVALGFLDYTTLERRRAACLEEVRVNAPLAPGIYLGVVAIVRSGERFSFAPEGEGGAVEYAVQMQSFREEDTLMGLITAGALTQADIVAVARRLAEFHRDAQVVEDWGAARVLASWERNVEELARTDHPDSWPVDLVMGFGRAFVASHAGELRERAGAGLARDGHGDLRCEHVLMRPSIRVVDRIEFDPGLRRTDIASDVAFLAMDLEVNGQDWAARDLVDAYRDAAMDPGGETLRAFYAAHWALVRAKVALICAADHTGERSASELERAHVLWSLGERLCWRARGPLALVVCGPAASGKSTLAAELSLRSGMPVVSSDEARKRMADLDPEERAGAEHYTAAFSRATYAELGRFAALGLRDHHGVIVDATCHARGDRRVLLDALRAAGGRRLLVVCEVPLEVAVERAGRRLGDPGRVSDATPEIAAAQYRAFEAFDQRTDGPLMRLDALQPLDRQIADVTCECDRVAAHGEADSR